VTLVAPQLAEHRVEIDVGDEEHQGGRVRLEPLGHLTYPSVVETDVDELAVESTAARADRARHKTTDGAADDRSEQQPPPPSCDGPFAGRDVDGLLDAG